MKNERIRRAMIKEGLTQNELAEILGKSTAEVSLMLKYELAQKEQQRIVEEIRTWAAAQEGA